MMKITTFVVLVMLFIIGCENIAEQGGEQTLYQGRTIQTESAPFLVQANSLAKDTDGTLVLDEDVVDGTVYGLETDTTVYAAAGGEGLSQGTWVDNLGSGPVAATAGSGLVITFETLALVTIVQANNIEYIDANGDIVSFSGRGQITALKIRTGAHGSVTFISSIKYGIGGDGGDWG
ncbi:hypothetical protein HQ531_07310 [bacterium]|nr:hypothetical protein [bacterium]